LRTATLTAHVGEGALSRARHAIAAFLRFCMRVFYRRIELVRVDRVPVEGPVIFAVNHPNGLVDPLFLICFAPRPVSFLAKAPLFGYPIIGWFVKTFDSIPVYRKQDKTTGTNAETFAMARQILQRGGSIAIFPEGTTHSDPQLRELKTGAARIALGANLEAMTIVPAGIYYTAKHLFRSSALVVFGDPIHVTSTGAEEPPFDVVEELTARIDEGLDAVTLQADSHAALELIGTAEDIFTATDDQPLGAEFDLRRRFIDGYHYLRQHDPARLARLQSEITRFEAELRRLGVAVHDLAPSLSASMLFRLAVLFPIALIGAVLNYPTYRLIGFLAKRFAKGESEMMATMKILAALACYPLTYIAASLAVGWRFGIAPAIATLVILPILGLIALRVFEDLDDVIGDARALFRPRDAARLTRERLRIREELVEVARGMGENAGT
jgi:glycerol-3-phosphate O-acyltransferase / dihydroxyacetone phosphate acyltransferase